MNVLGGSIYAVVTAVRLSRQFGKTTLIHPGRRLGPFPFSVLPEQFFEEMDVKPSKHAEQEIDKIDLEGETIETPARLYVCRTTPLLEEIIARNDVSFTTKRPHQTQECFFDCTGRSWRGIRVFQTLQTRSSPDKNFLSISVEPGLKISIKTFFKSIQLETVYSESLPSYSADLLALAERFSANVDYITGELFPTLSLLGSDFAEWYPNKLQLVKEADKVVGVIRPDSSYLPKKFGPRS
ncbi:MAG: hypothetical protein RMI49_03845 [Candidatus Caldarchaeum sp.]|nr:hypothetical protein [Candidatus Caldarchaeum sp.]